MGLGPVLGPGLGPGPVLGPGLGLWPGPRLGSGLEPGLRPGSELGLGSGSEPGARVEVRARAREHWLRTLGEKINNTKSHIIESRKTNEKS